MTELEKYEIINKSRSVEELKNAIKEIGDLKISTGEIWTVDQMCEYIDRIYEGDAPYNMATRRYGIRQQIMYIKYYH